MALVLHRQDGPSERPAPMFWLVGLLTMIAKAPTPRALLEVLVQNEAEIRASRKRPADFAAIRQRVEQKLAAL